MTTHHPERDPRVIHAPERIEQLLADRDAHRRGEIDDDTEHPVERARLARRAARIR